MKSIIFTLALLFAGVFTVSADVVTSANPVGSAEWKAGDYYFLKSGDFFVSLDIEKTDSVIVKKFGNDPTKATIDYALWEITSKSSALGTSYQFKNKRTQVVLSFEASENAGLNIAPGNDEWSFENGIIQAKYDNATKTMALTVQNGNLRLTDTGSEFNVFAPDTNFPLTAAQLGDGFQIFQLEFDKTYQGNIFEGKDLLAKDIAGEAGFVTLQIQGDETFDDGKAKYIGVDTLKTEITGAKDVFGAKFSLDSTRTEIHPNANWQKFKFLVDLKNDSLNICIAAAPNVNDDLASVSNVKVVYNTLDDKHILTVSTYKADGSVDQGALPSVKRKKGNPGSITTGNGVYFLKSAGKGETAGKYIVAYSGGNIITTDETPSIYQPEGQWYIKETNGMYSIVDRNTNTAILPLGEIFPVQGIANTFTFGNNTDSITVEYQNKVLLTDLFLGSRYFTKEEIANNGYALNLLSQTGINDLYVVTEDSLLMFKSGKAEEAIIFKFELKEDSVKNELLGSGMGALALGDTLYHAVYTIKELFTDNYVAYDAAKKALKLSATATPNEFIFPAGAEADKYSMNTNGQFISSSLSSAILNLSAEESYFLFEEVDAPEYASPENGHNRLSSDGKSLTMNPYTFFAEMKMEGQEITKAEYQKDNFSLWIEKAPSTPDKPLYFIAKGIPSATLSVPPSPAQMYYLTSLRDSALFDDQGNALVGFITSDTITTMKNSPALFALKTTENGNYVLESQKELGDNTRQQYIGIVNNRVVMSSKGIEFGIAKAEAPIANESTPETKVTVIGETGSIKVLNAAGKKISLVNILGQVMTIKYASTDNISIPVSRGIVFVVINGEPTQKALVK